MHKRGSGIQEGMIQSKSSFISAITALEQDDEEEVRLNLKHNRGEQRHTYKHYQPQISNQLRLHLILPDGIVDAMNLRSETYVQQRYTRAHARTRAHAWRLRRECEQQPGLSGPASEVSCGHTLSIRDVSR